MEIADLAGLILLRLTDLQAICTNWLEDAFFYENFIRLSGHPLDYPSQKAVSQIRIGVLLTRRKIKLAFKKSGQVSRTGRSFGKHGIIHYVPVGSSPMLKPMLNGD